MAREQRELLGPGRQLFKEGRERELCDDEQHDEPVQQLGNGAPAARGVSQGHDCKLMRLNASCLLQRLALLTCAALLTACPAPPRVSPPAAPQPVPGVAAHVGTPYTIVAGESLLTIRVYKGGAFAAAGHNHVIASHALSGIFYAADAPLQSSFEVHVPLESLSVDEAELRAQAGPDFPPEVPETAREGTRHNMLGPALLDADNDPEIVLSAVRLAPAQPPQSAVQTRVQARVRGAPHEFDVLVGYERSAERLV